MRAVFYIAIALTVGMAICMIAGYYWGRIKS